MLSCHFSYTYSCYVLFSDANLINLFISEMSIHVKLSQRYSMKKCIYLLMVLAALSVSAFTLSAQETSNEETVEETGEESSTPATIDLKDIVVKGDIFTGQSAYTVSRMDNNAIQKSGISRSADLLSEIPGITVGEYNQGGISNQVMMRGFATGVHGGDMGVYLDGIPINEYYGHGGGYADPNVLIPLEIEQVAVYKGPSSSQYGNFSKGGTAAFYTRKKGEYNDAMVKYGSFDTFDSQVAFGTRVSENMWNNTAVQVYRTGGYTESAEHLLGNASTRFTYDISSDLELSVSLRAHAAEWNAPKYMTRAQFEADDTPFSDFNQPSELDGGNRQQTSERVDLAYTLNENTKLLFWGYGLQSDWTRWRNQEESDYGIRKYGSGVTANYINSLIKGIAGLEFHRDSTGYSQYNTTNRARTGITSDIETTFSNYALFTEAEILIHRLFKPTVGVRADLFDGEEKNKLTDSTRDFSVSDYWHISPKTGFVSTLIEKTLEFRANVSNGFIMPPSEALHENADVDPANIWQYETGLTYTFRDMVWIDVAAFQIDTKNEVQDTTGSGDYKNIGETRRRGIESAAKLKPLTGLEISGDFTYTTTEILKNADSAMEGKEIQTVPETMGKVAVAYYSTLGAYGMAQMTHHGKSYVNEDNTESYSGYNLFDAGIGYTAKTDTGNVDISFKVKNIFDQKYAAFAGWDLWAAGAPRSYWVSTSIKW